MANFNKVVLVGRLTRDPEIRSTGSGLKIAGIGFAVSNRKKDQSGQWVDDPMFIDVTAFDRESGRGLATTVETYCKKGAQLLIEGKLTLDSWEDKNGGGKRTKHKIIADVIQLLDTRGSTGGGGGGMDDEMDAPPPRAANNNSGVSRSAPPARPAPKPAPARQYDNDDSGGDGGDSEIPF